jgi:hypothetical protein
MTRSGWDSWRLRRWEGIQGVEVVESRGSKHARHSRPAVISVYLSFTQKKYLILRTRGVKVLNHPKGVLLSCVENHQEIDHAYGTF